MTLKNGETQTFRIFTYFHYCFIIKTETVILECTRFRYDNFRFMHLCHNFS